jgi:superfamily II DNA or RNA helicase
MKLRPYQEQSIEKLRGGIRDGHTRQVLCAPTGAGKSIIMMSMINGIINKGSKALFICERRILVNQFSKHLDAHDIDHGIIMANSWRHRPDANIHVASIQTLERMESWPAYDIIFIDELHACCRASVLEMIKNRPNMRIVGATATPFHPAIAQHFSNVVNVTTMRELVNDGHLAPFRVFVAHEIDTKGLKTVAGEWKKDDLEDRGLKVVGDIVTDYLRLSAEIFGGPRKTICFSSGVAHGAELAAQFNESGVMAIQISYKDDDDYKADVLMEFAKPDTEIKMLISTDVLTRGFDQSDIEHVILARPLKKSFSSHVQMCGRGARPHDSKSFCVIQDNSGNWLRFLDSWNDLFGNGVNTLASDEDMKKRKEPTEKEKKEAKCPACGMVMPPYADTCPNCGHVRPVRNMVAAVPGEMKELGEQPKAEKFSIEYKTRFYAELLGYARDHGQKPGAAYYRYKEKFGVGPSMKTPEPVTPGVEVLNWIKHRAIRFAKGAKA